MGGFKCTRACLVLINILYLIFSIILISVAAYSRLASIIGSLTIVGGIIACGVFLMLVSILGIIGAVHHHQIALFFYMIIIFLIFLIQFSVAVACLAVNDDQKKNLLNRLWNQADNATRQDAQHQLDCCGFDNATEINLGLSFPACGLSRCCQGSNHPCCLHENNDAATATTTQNLSSSAAPPYVPSTEPPICPCNTCYSRIEQKTTYGFRLTGGVGLFFAFIEVFGVWFAVRYRNMKDPTLIPENFL